MFNGHIFIDGNIVLNFLVESVQKMQNVSLGEILKY